MNSSQQIQALFERELTLFSQLLELFQTEKEILKKRDTDTLQAFQLEKQPVVTELEQLQADTDSILKNAGFENGLADIDAFIAQQEKQDQTTLLKRWQELITLGERCHMENLTIGGIIELNRLQVETALGILRGNKVGPSEYNTRGRMENNAVSQTLAKA